MKSVTVSLHSSPVCQQSSSDLSFWMTVVQSCSLVESCRILCATWLMRIEWSFVFPPVLFFSASPRASSFQKISVGVTVEVYAVWPYS